MREQLVTLPGKRIPARERALALDLCQLRQRLVRLMGGIQACSCCARGHPPPNGLFEGGYCCGSPTERLFTEAELAQLHASGTRPRHLRSGARRSAGCAFRTGRGCSLPPVHRPNTCVSYICQDLARELDQRGDLDRAEALARRITDLSNQCARLRQDRLLDIMVGSQPGRAP